MYNGMDSRNVCPILLFCESTLGVCCNGDALWTPLSYLCMICKRVLDPLCFNLTISQK